MRMSDEQIAEESAYLKGKAEARAEVVAEVREKVKKEISEDIKFYYSKDKFNKILNEILEGK